MKPWHDLVTPCRFGSLGFQSVCRATAANIGGFVPGQLVRRLEYVVCHGLQRGAGGVCGSPSRDSKITPLTNRRASMPNPSLKGSHNSLGRSTAPCIFSVPRPKLLGPLSFTLGPAETGAAQSVAALPPVHGEIRSSASPVHAQNSAKPVRARMTRGQVERIRRHRRREAAAGWVRPELMCPYSSSLETLPASAPSLASPGGRNSIRSVSGGQAHKKRDREATLAH